MKIPSTPAEIKQQMTREDAQKLFASHKADPHAKANEELQAIFVATQEPDWSPTRNSAAERWMALREKASEPPSAAEQAAAKAAKQFTPEDIAAAHQAKGTLAALKLNKTFMDSYLAGDKESVETFGTLVEAMLPITPPPLGHRENIWQFTPIVRNFE